MLLIDQHRRIQSVAVRNVGMPFVPEPFWHDEARVRSVFADWWSDLRFLQALSEELQLCGGTVPFSEPYPDGLIDAGMRAIARGAIDVASVLPDGVVITFDEEWPSEWYKFSMVGFPGRVIFATVAARLLSTPGNRHAFEAALAHPIGRRRSTEPPRQDATGHFSDPTDGSAALAGRAAWLLATRNLALIPRDFSRRRLRLVWVDHQIAYAPAPSSPAPSPSPASPAPAPSSAPASVLPDDPGDLSPQAEALIEAAEDGAPFCEECARRAAELANA